MRAILPVVLVAMLFTPTNSLAAEITFGTRLDTEDITFGLEPFVWTGPLDPSRSPDVIFLGGSINLVSGPLLDLVIDGSIERTIYTYGPGTLIIEASWLNPDSSIGQGAFHGTTEGFSLQVCEGCDKLFGGSLADDFQIFLGAGVFDAAFARVLGVEPNTHGDWATFGLEAITGDPSSRLRFASDHRGSADVTISALAVPEPGFLALSLVAGGAWIVRRRR